MAMAKKPAGKSNDAAKRLAAIYKEIMWLARRPNTTPSSARAWYTHIASNPLRKHLRRFSGKVSRRALDPGATLRLEHYKRLQTTLTQLVARHLKSRAQDAAEFVRVVTDCEQVHIVTVEENYAAMKAGGNYRRAGISLIRWKDVPAKQQVELWRRVLRGRVSNASDFKPTLPGTGAGGARKRSTRIAA